MQRYRVTAQSSANPSKVYELLLDGRTWPAWMGVDFVETQRRDPDLRLPHDPDRMGDVRRVQTGKYPFRRLTLRLCKRQESSE